MIDKAKNYECLIMSDIESTKFYERENRRIIKEYPDEIKRLLSYELCELDPSFLGFLHTYATVDVPKDFTVIDFGCNQAVQACYFKDCQRYIGIDNDVPINARFRQHNAEYYYKSIQAFMETDFLRLVFKEGLDLQKVFAICSYVPDDKAKEIVANNFFYARVVYCDEITCDRKPPILNFYNCLRLVDSCVKNGVIFKDPNDNNNMLIYLRDMPNNQPDGFYSMNAHHAARKLLEDGNGQRLLLMELASAGTIFEKEDLFTHEKEPVFGDIFVEDYLPKYEYKRESNPRKRKE